MVLSLNPQKGAEQDVVGASIIALLIDEVILAFVALVIFLTAGSLRSPTVFYGGLVVLFFGYHIVFEGIRGQTIGKILMGVVVGANNEPCTFGEAIIRNLLRTIDALGFYIVGLLVMLVTSHRQRVGDLVAGTSVVRSR